MIPGGGAGEVRSVVPTLGGAGIEGSTPRRPDCR